MKKIDKRTKEYKERQKYTQTFKIPAGTANQELDLPDDIVKELVKSITPEEGEWELLPEGTTDFKISSGLGDTIEKITKATGIKKVVEFLFDDCGCKEKKLILNRWYPYNKPNCLEEDEFKVLKEFYHPKKPAIINAVEQQKLLKVYNRVLNKKQNLSNCPSCVRNMIRELERIYVEYNK